MQVLVLRKRIEQRIVQGCDVGGLAGERGPTERSLALTEERTNERRRKAWKGERVFQPGALGLVADVVAVVEDDGTAFLKIDHGADVLRDRLERPMLVLRRILLAQLVRAFQTQAARHITREHVVRGGLVGDDVDWHAAAQQLGKDVGRVADESDRKRALVLRGIRRTC